MSNQSEATDSDSWGGVFFLVCLPLVCWFFGAFYFTQQGCLSDSQPRNQGWIERTSADYYECQKSGFIWHIKKIERR